MKTKAGMVFIVFVKSITSEMRSKACLMIQTDASKQEIYYVLLKSTLLPNISTYSFSYKA